MNNRIPFISDAYLSVPDTVRETYTRYHDIVITSIITATIVIVSLAWTDVVQSAIAYYYPKNDSTTISSKIYYASVITIFVILLQIYVFPYIQTQKSTE